MSEQPTAANTRWKRAMMIGSTTTVALSMASAMYFSGWSMWHVIEDKFGLAGRPELVTPMFVLFDLAAISCALLAIFNLLSSRPRGVPYLMVWVFSAASGLMSATDGHNLTSQIMRFAAPLVAATMLELLLSAKKHADAGTEGWVVRALRPIKARFGMLDRAQTDTEAARAAAAGKLAVLAYRMHQLPDGARRRKIAERRFLRRLRSSIERHSIASDGEMVELIQAGLATMYAAVAGTSAESVATLNPWARDSILADEPLSDAVNDSLTARINAPDPWDFAEPIQRAVLDQVPPSIQLERPPAKTNGVHVERSSRLSLLTAAQIAEAIREDVLATRDPNANQRPRITAVFRKWGQRTGQARVRAVAEQILNGELAQEAA
jgi:hypothetical protein